MCWPWRWRGLLWWPFSLSLSLSLSESGRLDWGTASVRMINGRFVEMVWLRIGEVKWHTILSAKWQPLVAGVIFLLSPHSHTHTHTHTHTGSPFFTNTVAGTIPWQFLASFDLFCYHFLFIYLTLKKYFLIGLLANKYQLL
jgi:hypothetical protein